MRTPLRSGLSRAAAHPAGIAACLLLAGLAASGLPGTGQGQGAAQPTGKYRYRLVDTICEVSHLNGSYSAAVNLSYKSKLLAENLSAAADAAQAAAADSLQAAETALAAARAAPAERSAPQAATARQQLAEAKSLAGQALLIATQASDAANKAYGSISDAQAADRARAGAETEKRVEDALTNTARRDSAFDAALQFTADLAEQASQVKGLWMKAQALEAEAGALLGQPPDTLAASGTAEGAAAEPKSAGEAAAAPEKPAPLVSTLEVNRSASDTAEAYSEALADAARSQQLALRSVRPFCLAKGAILRFEFDSELNWIVFVEEGSRFEEGTGVGLDLSKVGIDLSRIGIDASRLRLNFPQDRVFSGQIVTVPKKNLNAYDIQRLEGDGLGTFIVPFKVQDTGKDTRVIPGGAFGLYYGLQLGRLVYYAGLGVTPISVSDPKNSIPQTRVGFAPVLGIMNLISLSPEWQIGAVLGWDYLGSNKAPGWKGEGEPWVGMVIGTKVLTQSTRVPKVGPQ
ncbi:MAG: hypothetical protein ACHQZQ_02865 [SAR324 cluster bacterium]